MNKKRMIFGHMLALFSNYVWASVFVSTKILLNVMSPIDILLYRFVIGYLFLFALRPKLFKTGSFKMELNFIICGLTGIALNCVLESTALLYTGSAIVSVIVAASPFMVGLLARFVFGQKLNRFFFVGFILAISGIAMICLIGNSDNRMNFIGELISIGASLAWAIYGLFSEKINKMNFDAILVTRRMFFYGTLFVFPVYLIKGDFDSLRYLSKPLYLGNIVFLGMVACALAFFAWNKSIEIIGTILTLSGVALSNYTGEKNECK